MIFRRNKKQEESQDANYDQNISIEAKEILATAPRMLKQERYEELYRMCDRVRSLQNPPPAETLYYGTLALFGIAHFKQAEPWIDHHGSLTDYDSSHLYLEAYLHLHAERYEAALLCWTRILEIDPSDTFADSLIVKLKEGSTIVQRELEQKSSLLKYVPLYPYPKHDDIAFDRDTYHYDDDRSDRDRKHVIEDIKGKSSFHRDHDRKIDLSFIKKPVVVASASVVLLTSLLTLIFLYRADFSRSSFTGKSIEDKLPPAPLSGTIIDPDEYGKNPPRYVYENKTSVLFEYNRARELAASGMVNQARALIGRIELSNAGFEIKERALILRDSIPEITESELLDPVSVATVFKEPFLYRSADVLWSGRVLQVRKHPDSKSIADIILGDGDYRIFLALTDRTKLKDANQIKQGDTLRCFGTFKEIDREGRLFVDARNIHP